MLRTSAPPDSSALSLGPVGPVRPGILPRTVGGGAKRGPACRIRSVRESFSRSPPGDRVLAARGLFARRGAVEKLTGGVYRSETWRHGAQSRPSAEARQQGSFLQGRCQATIY